MWCFRGEVVDLLTNVPLIKLDFKKGRGGRGWWRWVIELSRGDRIKSLWSAWARCRGQNSHPLSEPLNCFTHFGSRLVNEPPCKFPWLSAHGALCPFISLLCASFREPQITALLCTLCENTYTVHGCSVEWDISVIDLWSALLITDGCNCYKLCYLGFPPPPTLWLMICSCWTLYQVRVSKM